MGEEDDELENTPQRPTVKPAFDIERYAEEEITRETLPTITDEAATEEARIASVLMDSNPPRPRLSDMPDVQIGVRYADVDALDSDDQLVVLRARLAPMTRTPTLVRKLTELGPIVQDPRTAFVLSFVDGLLPLETIVEVSGMPEVETLRILDRAVEQNILTFGKP